MIDRILAATRTRVLFAWLVLGGIAAGCAALPWPAAHLGNELLPNGMDSFYHARRILDTAADPAAFYEFDSRIHAPEGSLLTWPWGYDYALAWIVRLGVKLTPVTNPMAILIWIPVAAVFASVGLMMLLAHRLGLGIFSTILAGLCVALSPLTQFMHGVGIIDHHYAEYIFVLLTLVTGLHWFLDLSSRRSAIALGVVLGIAPAIHNGLFVLQVPILATLLLLWLQGRELPRSTTCVFAVTLLAATLAVLVPSLPFRLGHFEYYTLSWFHFYVACGTAVVSVILTLPPRTNRSFLVLGIATMILLLPLIRQIIEVRAFLGGTTIRLGEIIEMRSLPQQIMVAHGARHVSNSYSLFIWLWPLTLALCAYRGWQERRTGRLFFWVCAACGLLLLAAQYRLQYFGSFALYLPWLMFIDEALRRWPAQSKTVTLAAALAVLLLYSFPLRSRLAGLWLPANDPSFSTLRPIFDSLKSACAKEPGVVLADNDAGHYIRYYTECSVIANNFLLTRQHGDKVAEMDRLMNVHTGELPAAAPYVRYLLLRPLDIVRRDDGTFGYVWFSKGVSTLPMELLVGRTPHNPAVTLLDEVVLPELNGIPYARLYRLEKPTPAVE